MMKILRIKGLFIAAMLALFSLSTNAALVDMGTYLTDTNTKMDYLKLSQTFGYSYTDALVNDELGLIAKGWELSSQSALIALDQTYSDAHSLMIAGLQDCCNIITNNDTSLGQNMLPTMVIMDDWYSSGSYFTQVANVGVSESQDTLAVSFQRVSAVPVPPAAWLFGSALIGLVGVGRRKKA